MNWWNQALAEWAVAMTMAAGGHEHEQEGLLLVSDHHAIMLDYLGTKFSFATEERGIALTSISGAETRLRDLIQERALFVVEYIETRLISVRNHITDRHTLLWERLDTQDLKLDEVDVKIVDLQAQVTELEGQVTELRGQVSEVMQAVMELGDQNLRMEIERNLSLDDDDPRHHRIASFEMPAAVGGQLELVRQVVLETHQMHVGAGLDSHPLAAQEVSLGDTAYNNGNYSQAFDHFRNAYRMIVY